MQTLTQNRTIKTNKQQESNARTKQKVYYNEQTLACVWLPTRCQEGHPCEKAGEDPYKGGGAILLGRNLLT